jgi:UDP-GlcNAc3NAcA epimerase
MSALTDSGNTVIEDVIVHTGQHYDPALSDVFFDELEIPRPDVDLQVGSGSHGWQTARMLEAIELVIIDQQPDVVVIYGDTNSTVAGALAAAKLCIPVAHVEAGLRSFDRQMPEEVNRIVSDHLSEILFAPTQTAVDNLARENLADRARLVGDVMLDAINFNRELSRKHSSVLDTLGISDAEFGVVTLHRAGNTDSDRLIRILKSLNEVASRYIPLVFPVHPRTTARIESEYPDWTPDVSLRLIDPVGYLDMIRLVDGATLVCTDSGGLQKEAFFLNVPCVTLRNETEWPETVAGGGNTLVGAEHGKILATTEALTENTGMGEAQIDYGAGAYFGDGHAAEKIVADIVKFIANK